MPGTVVSGLLEAVVAWEALVRGKERGQLELQAAGEVLLFSGAGQRWSEKDSSRIRRPPLAVERGGSNRLRLIHAQPLMLRTTKTTTPWATIRGLKVSLRFPIGFLKAPLMLPQSGLRSQPGSWMVTSEAPPHFFGSAAPSHRARGAACSSSRPPRRAPPGDGAPAWPASRPGS